MRQCMHLRSLVIITHAVVAGVTLVLLASLWQNMPMVENKWPTSCPGEVTRRRSYGGRLLATTGGDSKTFGGNESKSQRRLYSPGPFEARRRNSLYHRRRNTPCHRRRRGTSLCFPPDNYPSICPESDKYWWTITKLYRDSNIETDWFWFCHRNCHSTRACEGLCDKVNTAEVSSWVCFSLLLFSWIIACANHWHLGGPSQEWRDPWIAVRTWHRFGQMVFYHGTAVGAFLGFLVSFAAWASIKPDTEDYFKGIPGEETWEIESTYAFGFYMGLFMLLILFPVIVLASWFGEKKLLQLLQKAKEERNQNASETTQNIPQVVGQPVSLESLVPPAFAVVSSESNATLNNDVDAWEAPTPLATTAVAGDDLRVELNSKTRAELRERAKDMSIHEDKIQAADDDDFPKTALIDLIVVAKAEQN